MLHSELWRDVTAEEVDRCGSTVTCLAAWHLRLQVRFQQASIYELIYVDGTTLVQRNFSYPTLCFRDVSCQPLSILRSGDKPGMHLKHSLQKRSESASTFVRSFRFSTSWFLHQR